MAHIETIQATLERVFGKATSLAATETATWLCWCEGDPLGDHPPQPPRAPSPTAAVGEAVSGVLLQKSTASTCLPNWLDSLVYKRLGGVYAPDYEKFRRNIELSADDLKTYLGTYFPRSYGEVFCIFDMLFAHPAIKQALQATPTVSVFDLGCGTGGDLIGLLTALAKHFNNLKELRVHAVDGHAGALELLAQLLRGFSDHSHLPVRLTTTCAQIEDLDVTVAPTEIDFFLSCKAVSEVIGCAGGPRDSQYLSTLLQYAPRLSATGMLLLLDVTTRPQHHTLFYPSLLNQQVAAFVRTNDRFRTLLPLPCSFYEIECTQGCFSQREFSVSCSAKARIPTRVAYRIVAGRAFVDKINGLATSAGYEFPPPAGSSVAERPCRYSALHQPRLDAYALHHAMQTP